MNALDPYLPFGLSGDNLLLLLVASLAFMLVMMVWFGLVERDPMAERAQRLRARRDELRSQLVKDRPTSSRRAERLSLMKRVVEGMRLMQSQQEDRLLNQLAQAGFRSRDTVIVFLFFKVATPVILGVLAFVYLYILKIGDLSTGVVILIIVALMTSGWFAPQLYISNATTKRQLEITKGLPDALDLLVICAESGLSLDASLERVAREIGQAAPELAEELELTSIELGFLPERRQALMNLNRRTNLQAIRGVVNTLIQTEKYGTPLSQSLRILSSEFRDQRMLRAEEKAARLPATLTVPMIVFILPVLFIVLIGPAIISVMDTLGS